MLFESKNSEIVSSNRAKRISKIWLHTVVRILCVPNRIFEKRRCYMSFRSDIRRELRKRTLRGSKDTKGASEKSGHIPWNDVFGVQIVIPVKR